MASVPPFIAFDAATKLPPAAALAALVPAISGNTRTVVGDGTDLTTTLQSALQEAIGSAFGLRRTVRLVGAFLTKTLTISSNTRLDATGATITLAVGTSSNILRNAAVTATTTRDSNIEVIGGTWDRGANGGTGTGLHSLFFRRVDGLIIRGITYLSTAGKYGINIGDATRFVVEDIAFNCSSDGVHVNGPASNGRIRRITGTTGDDSVALTGNDYAAYADVSGNITNVEISDINSTSAAANLVKVLAGQAATCDDITVRRVRGAAALFGVWLGDDNGYTGTQNGTYGTLRVDDVAMVSNYASGGAQVYSNLLQGAKRIIITDLYVQAGTNNKYGALIGFAGTIDSLLVDRVRIADGLDTRRAVTVQGGTSAILSDVELRHLYTRGVTNFIGLELKGTSGVSARLVDADVSTATAGGTDWVYVTASATFNRVVVSGGQITGGKDVVRAETATTVVLDGGVSLDTLDRIANFYNAAFLVVLGAVRVGTVTNRLFMANAGAQSMTIAGGGHAELPAAPGLYHRSGAIPIRVNGASLPATITDLTPTAYDQCTLATAAGAIPVGAKVISNGTVWKDMYTGTTSG